MRDQLEVLQKAIADVVYWRWWTEKLPSSFQLGFGGVQIYQSASDLSRPPSNICALRFQQPLAVRFLEFEAGDDPEWFLRLQRDGLNPPSLDCDAFHLNDEKAIRTLVSQAVRVRDHFLAPKLNKAIKPRTSIPVRAFGGLGIQVEALSLQVLTHYGEIPLSSVPLLHGDWWEYWKKYWSLRETPKALPKDYACGVTHSGG